MVPKPSRLLTILGQDPSLRDSRGRVVTARVAVPNERLGEGPCGYRVQVVDFDASSDRLYVPRPAADMGTVHDPKDPYAVDGARDEKLPARRFNARYLDDPRFHAQHVYAIVMRTLAHFERALGRRVSWSFGGHQLKVASHAFADANAFFSPEDEALFFGYFAGPKGTIFTCLSHDIVVHEATHALVHGLRPRYLEPSRPDQAAFHEAFADVVALLSVFSLPEVVSYAVGKAVRGPAAAPARLADLTVERIQRGVLLGLGEEFGDTLSGVRGAALRRSVALKPSPDLLDREEYQEEHRRGEVLVAAMLHAFLDVYRERLSTLGRDTRNRLPQARVAEEGADIAERMLVMAIRAIDYLPPTDVEFGDYLSALVTSDFEIRPDDSRYHVRDHLRRAFARFGIAPTSSYGGEEGRWKPPLEHTSTSRPAGAPPPPALDYGFVHREALERDRDEVFRFLWDNRAALGLCDEAYTEVGSVLPCLRVDQDGFTLRETVAAYVQILTLRADELPTLPIPGTDERIQKPEGLEDWRTVRLLGGGALLFDEYGKLKYHVRNAVLNPGRQTRRLQHLVDSGRFALRDGGPRGFAALHMKGMRADWPRATREEARW